MKNRVVVKLFFRNRADDTLAKLERALSLSEERKEEALALIRDAVADIVAVAEEYELGGDLWETFLALQLAGDDNPLGRAAGLRGAPSGSIAQMAPRELWRLHETIANARNWASREDETLRLMENYVPSGGRLFSLCPEAESGLQRLAVAFKTAETPKAMYDALVEFYGVYGAGIYALNSAFHWSPEKRLTPVPAPDTSPLASLVGYESQKRELLSNTEYFLSGKAANNVLLFGDSGTGKSSSVRALLNQPGFVRRGLRMIEVRKGQLNDVPEVLALVRSHNYRFVLFMDDLSFEEFEVEYKHLKAVIEGGLESRPENVVIYATSNRRHIVRETWADRETSAGDVHGGDTMREKLSLADRFGVTIWYGATGKEEYIRIVRALAAREGVSMEDAELESLALRWELGGGGFTGRTARQFVQHLLLRQGQRLE